MINMGTGKYIFLYPVSLLYGLITGIRNFLYNTGILASVQFHLPVICVGNIAVGGTGKTPHTEYLAGMLKEKFKVATLSRGYRRKSRGFRIASMSSPVRDIGDEPLQICRKFPDVLVAVDRNRVNGVRNILEINPETEVIILDDAFQHRRITPGFSILLSDFGRLIFKDHIMPYGNLRESKSNMKRADIILITKCPESITPMQRRLIMKMIDKAPYQNLYFTSLQYNSPLHLFGTRDDAYITYDISQFNDAGVVLITGIANPLPLKEYLQNTVKEIIHLSYPDHHNYKEKDIARISSAFSGLKTQRKYLFTTEKDAVRLRECNNIPEPLKPAFFYLPISIHFLNDDKDKFDNLIIDYVRKNKRNNRISEVQRDQ